MNGSLKDGMKLFLCVCLFCFYAGGFVFQMCIFCQICLVISGVSGHAFNL